MSKYSDFEPTFDSDAADSTAADDFGTDPITQADLDAATDLPPLGDSKPPAAASAEPTADQPPEDGPKDAEPDGEPTDFLEPASTYPEADVDAPSRMPVASRPCRAGP